MLRTLTRIYSITGTAALLGLAACASPRGPDPRHIDGQPVRAHAPTDQGTQQPLRVRSTGSQRPGPVEHHVVQDPDGYVFDRSRLAPRIVYKTTPWAGSVNFYFGGRSMTNQQFWEPHDDVLALGAEVELHKQDSLFGLEFGVQGFAREEEDVSFNEFRRERSSVIEGYFGPRMTFDLDGVRPYIGGGASFLSARQEREAISLSFQRDLDEVDSSVAAYAHVGVQVDVAPHVHIGFDVRGVFGSQIELFGANGDADYIQGSLIMGANW